MKHKRLGEVIYIISTITLSIFLVMFIFSGFLVKKSDLFIFIIIGIFGFVLSAIGVGVGVTLKQDTKSLRKKIMEKDEDIHINEISSESIDSIKCKLCGCVYGVNLKKCPNCSAKLVKKTIEHKRK